MKIIDILNHLSNGDYAILQKVWDENSGEFWVGLELYFDPTVDYTDIKIPMVADDDENKTTFYDFYQLVIINKKENPEVKKKQIDTFAINCSSELWNNWYRPILKKKFETFDINEIVKFIKSLTSERK